MGIVIGGADDMDAVSAFLRLVNTAVAELYANRSGQKLADVLDMMKKETWMNAKDAVSKGFADVALVKDSKKKAYASATMEALKKSIFALKGSGVSLAALGESPRFAVRMSATSPGASGNRVATINLPKGNTMKIAEQIASFEAKRAASVARMELLMSAAAEKGESLAETEAQEWDGLDTEVKTIDGHLVRMKKQQELLVAGAKPVNMKAAGASGAAEADPDNARDLGAGPIISVKANVEKAIPFTRYAKALMIAKGSPSGALAYAQANKQWMDQTPEVAKVLMAAVAAGDTTTAGWASELVYAQNLTNAFIEFLRPMTILGRVPGLRKSVV